MGYEKYTFRPGDKLEFSIVLESNVNSLYYGIGRHGGASEKLLDNIMLLSEKTFNFNIKDSDPRWYSWKYTDYSKAYSELKSLIHSIESYISENSNK
jgi:hypothetical protein